MASGDGFGSVMQCHCTTDNDPKVCVGFALQVGSSCIAYRFAMITGLVDHDSMATDAPLHDLGSVLARHGGIPNQP